MKAFPIDVKTATYESFQGMDLRDYFAAKVISGLMANGEAYNIRELSKYAYELADAMMEARTK